MHPPMHPPMHGPPDRAGGPSRREVLTAGAAAASGALLGLGRAAHADESEAGSETPLPRRRLGKTGFDATLFGLGCFPLGGLPEEDAAVAVIVRALDAGCNYVDTAPSYGRRGAGEQRVAKALRLRPDHEVFLATKTHTRTAEDARRDLEGSLERLGRARLDLVQVHAVKDAADLERVLAAGGPLETLVAARKEGLVRYIGITGHYDPEVMRGACKRSDFDTVLFPVNCVDVHFRSFEKEMLPTAVEKGLGRVAMKAFAGGNLLKKGVAPEACLRYVYGLDVATVVVGCRTVEEVDLAARMARENRPLDAEERATLLRETQPHRGTRVEWYKRA